MSGASCGGGAPFGPDRGLFSRANVRHYETVLTRQFAATAGKAGLDVADLIQETLRRALQQRAHAPDTFDAQFPDADRLLAWAAVVVRNLLRDHTRSFYGQRVSLQAEIDEAAAGVSPDAEEVALARMVMPVLARLSKRDGRVLWLREVESYSYAEIAREIGVPEAQVSAIIARARGRLRDRYRLAVGALVAPGAVLRWFRRRSAEVSRLPADPAAFGPATVVVASVALGFTAGITIRVVPAVPERYVSRSADDQGGANLPLPRRVPPPAPRQQSADSRTLTPRPRPVNDGDGRPALPKPTARVCVADSCVSSPGDPNDPGYELYVDAPQPIGRQGVKQDQVPVCDAVPPTVGPVGCERHG